MVQRSKIYKILEITADQFMRMGLGAGKYTTAASLFYLATGIDPFFIPGTLRGGYNPSQIGAATVADTIKYFLDGEVSGVAGYIFGYGNAGKLYRITPGTDAIELLQTTVASVGNGFEIYKGAIYYSRNEYLGKMTNIASTPPTFNDTFGTFTHSIAQHPLHTFAGKLYCGDGDHLDMNDGTTHSNNVLDIPSDLTIIDIDDDGYYLVIGAVKLSTQGGVKTASHIFFWDGISLSWNIEYVIQEGQLTGISNIGGRKMVAFAGMMYSFTVSSSPEVFVETSPAYGPFSSSDFSPFAGSIQYWVGRLIWANNDKILAYGKVLFNTPKIIVVPFSLANILSIFYSATGGIYASTTDDKLYKIASGNINATIETGLIDLKNPYLISRIKLFTVDTLSGGPTITISLCNEDMSETFTKTLSGAYRSFWGDGAEITAQLLRVIITLTSGAVFRKVEIYGRPLPNEITY